MATHNRLETCGTFDSLFRDSCLSLDVLHILENDLELYEKVSLLFLLYDDIHIAQQSLSLILKAHEGSNSTESTCIDLIHPWACSYGKYWREKLVEGLLIIQAFSNINKLGLHLDSLNNHFLPKCAETSTFIHPIKKMLYKICESMTIENTKMVIKTTMDDEKCPHFKIDENYHKFFELFLLKLLEIKYITLGSWKPSLVSEELKTKIPSQMGNFVSVLKQLRLGAHWSNLNSSENLINNDLKLSGTNNHNSNPSASDPKNAVFANLIQNMKELNNCPISGCVNREIYPIIDGENMGIAVIINQMRFDQTEQSNEYPPLENRLGSDVDRDKLVDVWKMYGFKPIVHENLKHKDIRTKIKHVIDNDTKPTDSAFVICILSHGEEGCVFGSDNIPVEVKDIEKLLYGSVAHNLIGKPKIIIIQACQGKRFMKIVQTSVPIISNSNLKTDGPPLPSQTIFLPERSDLIRYWATGPECISYRDTVEGSWFIQMFCKILEQYGERIEFNDMCKIINDRMGKKRNEGTGQMPEVTSCCRKNFFLPPKKLIIKNNIETHTIRI